MKRVGFCLKHAAFFTSTSVQGHTLRGGITIDCARIEPRGRQGLSEDEWWLHLYVLLSRATCMEDMLLLRPPPRELLERGPPKAVRAALEHFDEVKRDSVSAAEALVVSMGFPVKPS